MGVTKQTELKDIKKAYYRLAKLYHPDANKNDPDASEKFQQVADAYEVLTDDTKRQEYDTFEATMNQMDAAAKSSGGTSAGPMPQYTYEARWKQQSNVNPEDLFHKVFGDMNFEQKYSDFADNRFGRGRTTEVGLVFFLS